MCCITCKYGRDRDILLVCRVHLRKNFRMQSLYFVKLQTGRGQMTEERTGNNSPGVWHRHLCVLWAQVDSCLLPPVAPFPLLVTRTSWMWAEGEEGTGGRGHLTGLNKRRREMLWTLTLVLNYLARPRSDVGVRMASPHLTGPGLWLWRDIFCFDSSAKISPARTLWPLERSFLLHILSWLGLLPVTLPRECCKYKLSYGMCQCV